MTLQQGIIVEDFEHLTREDWNAIRGALEFQRSVLESRLKEHGWNNAEQMMSDAAYVTWDKLVAFEASVNMQIGIREYILVPITKSRIKELQLSLNRDSITHGNY